MDLLADGKPVLVDDSYGVTEEYRKLLLKGWLTLPAPKATVLPIVQPEKSSPRKKRGRTSSL
jgi:hypothetical protein